MAKEGWDRWLLLIVCVLIGFGLVMLYSASAVMASQRMGHHFVLVANQMQKLAVGFVLLLVGLKFDYRWYKKFIYPIFGLALLLLMLVAIPQIGMVQNGARRWFSLFGFSFQPAEVAKIAAIMYLSYSVSKKGDRMVSFSVGFIPHLMMVGLMVGLLMLQPDFGSSVILAVSDDDLPLCQRRKARLPDPDVPGRRLWCLRRDQREHLPHEPRPGVP